MSVRHLTNYIKTIMNKNIVFVPFFLGAILLNHALFAQKEPTVSISGIVNDAELKVPLPFVTVFVTPDGSDEILTGQITNEQGYFELSELAVGSYELQVQFVGYQPYSKSVELSADQLKVDFGIIEMYSDVAVLETVEVTAERSTIEQRIDRKVINIGKDLATVGPTAADLMVNLPSVNVDQEGNISLRGNENVVVLVDGKPTNQSAAQLLQQIPSGSIKAIELITNPSAKYVPEGMSGIINIVLKKNTNRGFNGNVNAGLTLGNKVRYNAATDLNYRSQKVNYYFNYALTDAPMPTWGEIYRADEPSEEDWYALNDRITHLFKTGADFNLSDKTIASAYTIQNAFRNNGERSTDILFPMEQTLNFGQAYKAHVENYASSYNFDLRHQFSDHASIEFEMDHGAFDGEESADFQFYGTNLEVADANESISNVRKNTKVNLDFERSFAHSNQLEVGLEARIQDTDNAYDTSNPNFVSSDYQLDRDIYSFYVNYQQQVGKWSYQLGARLERFEQSSDFEPEGSDREVYDDLIQSIYPTVFVGFIPNPETQVDAFNLSISRRVDRPNLLQLNPSRAWSSARITNVGNPALVPQFTNSIELNYTRQFEAGSLTSGLFFRKIFNEITRFGFNDPDNPGGILFSYDNYQNNSAYGFELSGNIQVTPEWSFNSSFDLYSQTQRGVAQEALREVQNVIYNFRTNHSLKINKQLTLQVIGLYRGGSTNLQYRTLSFYFMNIGARYRLFDGKGHLNASFNDVFHTQRFAFEGERPTLQEGNFFWDSQTFFIGYSHKLGSGKKQGLKRKKRDQNEKKSSGGF